MSDNEKHWTDELYKKIGMQRRNSATWTLNWLFCYDFIIASENEFIVLWVDRTDHVYVLTDKGVQTRAATDRESALDFYAAKLWV
ncbi:hypothetical protein FHY52_04490 [Nocardia nova]|uniref:hypothetical protein n=1 Tax=Nocardia nova TaxID=37330 RepID=UPI0025B134E1|nr:hypothetical protein [Nocardia nova]MDN2495957.1 hypothetical protein [Nocardia nova]